MHFLKVALISPITAASALPSYSSLPKIVSIASSPAAGFKCPGEGFFPDPDNCQNFFKCSIGQGGKLTPYSFTCPRGTIWCQSQQTCNYLEQCPEGCSSDNDTTASARPADTAQSSQQVLTNSNNVNPASAPGAAAAGDTLDYVFTLTAMDKKCDVGIDGSDPSLGAALVLDGPTALKYVLIDGHLSLSTNGQNGRSYQVGSISEGAAGFQKWVSNQNRTRRIHGIETSLAGESSYCPSNLVRTAKVP